MAWEKTYRVYVDFVTVMAGRGKQGVENDVVKIEVSDGRKVYNLPQIVYHSPTGMQSGYGGSGPSDLALTIMADYFSETPATVKKVIRGGFTRQGHLRQSNATQYYQQFKTMSKIVHVKLKQSASQDEGVLEFVITEAEIRDIIQRIDERQK